MDYLNDNSKFGEQYENDENEDTIFWWDFYTYKGEDNNDNPGSLCLNVPNPIQKSNINQDDTPKPKVFELTETNGDKTNLKTNQPTSDVNLEPGSEKNIKFKTENQTEIKPKKGRRKNKDKNICIGKHNKFSVDNISKKVKAYFSNNIVDFINYAYLCEYPNKKEKLVYRIKRRITENIYGEENKKWFNMKVKDYLSQERTLKFKDLLKNKRNIDAFYKEESNSKLIEYFEMRIRDFYKIYIFGEKEEKEKKFKGFKTLEEDKKRLKEMEDLDENNQKSYIEKFEYIAINLEVIFLGKKYRKKKKVIN